MRVSKISLVVENPQHDPRRMHENRLQLAVTAYSRQTLFHHRVPRCRPEPRHVQFTANRTDPKKETFLRLSMGAQPVLKPR